MLNTNKVSQEVNKSSNLAKALPNEKQQEIGLLLLVYKSDGREGAFKIDLSVDYVKFLIKNIKKMNVAYEALEAYAHQELFKIFNTDQKDGYNFNGNEVYLMISFEEIIKLLENNVNNFGCIIKICENDLTRTFNEVMDYNSWNKDVQFINDYGIDEYQSYRVKMEIFKNIR